MGPSRRSRRILKRLPLALAISVLTGLTGSPPAWAQAGADSWPVQRSRESEDPFNQIYAALLEDAHVTRYFARELPKRATITVPIPQKEPIDAVPVEPVNRIHPLLRRWMAERPDASEPLLITLEDDARVPRFPEPAITESRDSSTNRRVQARNLKIIAGLQARRAEQQEEFVAELDRMARDRDRKRDRKSGGVEFIESFWLVNTVLVKAPLAVIPILLERPEVLYIEPQHSGEEPPANDIAAGRAEIVSDPYFDLGQTGGWIGLLDTGLRFSHTLFNSPSHIAFRRDCVNGGSNCNTGSSLNPNDDCWNHGTSTAAIITGNNNLGNGSRGVTGITLDSFKVYPTSRGPSGACNGGLDQGAVLRGFQTAIGVLDRVIVAEMQAGSDENSAISMAAEAAFNAGAVVIAANGNNGPNARTVNAPANARRVIGVGNFDVQSLTQITSESRGPTGDGRFKPDIQAPTNTVSASNASDTAVQTFTGTSGATPYGAGAAALLRNWLRGTSFSIDPGQVYAQLILSGQQPYPFNNTSGAGPLRLPTDGWAWWGKVAIGAGQTINIPLGISGASTNTFDGALWWPESSSRHNDVDLYLVDPSGVVRASSVSIPSVYERARVAGAVANGTWTLRIVAYNVSGTQNVYFAAHVRLR
jgi:serine protease AprX